MFLRAEGVAFLGGFARLIQRRGGEVYFLWDTLRGKVRANLAQNGFIKEFGGPDEPGRGNSIPYFANFDRRPEEFATFLKDQWLLPTRIGIRDIGIDALNSAFCEVYLNAFEHSATVAGIHCCGQHYPNKRELVLCLVDFGRGIPANVRRYMQKHAMPSPRTDAECMKWAFAKGNTTREDGVSGGLGLHVLSQFATINCGELEYSSHGGRASVRNSVLKFASGETDFEGTMISLRIRCNGSFYEYNQDNGEFSPFSPD